MVLGCFGACREPSPEIPSGEIVLQAWVHSGQEAEREVVSSQVERFNDSQPGLRIDLTMIPEGSYNAQVQAAALAGDLPDLLEFDGPFVYNYVWQGHLIPLRDLLDPDRYADLIPSIIAQGTFEERLWTVGIYDSGLGLYGNRRKLLEVGASLPGSPSRAWSVEQFNTILEKLAEKDPDGQVLDLKLNYRGEWFTFAFSPTLVSAGGDLISRPDRQTANGILNSPASVAAMSWFQRWVKVKKLVDPNLDDDAFTGGRVALSWVGHWEYPRYREAYGQDLVLLPLPDFGIGTRTGQGSWSWGITRKCSHPKAAAGFLNFLLEDRQILEMTRANGAVPATFSAIQHSQNFREGKPLHLFVTQLTEGFAVPRPRTPAYPVITALFRSSFKDILEGADVQRALDRAAREISQDIRDNRGYPMPDRLGEEARQR